MRRPGTVSTVSVASLFGFEPVPHQRRHGPRGYDDYQSYKPWLRDDFDFRCAYCRIREQWTPGGHAGFGVDHLLPQASAPGAALDYENLMYACARCNSIKRDQPGVLDPCAVGYGAVLTVKEDGLIEASTLGGWDHIDVLDLNDPRLVAYRLRLAATLRRLLDGGGFDVVAWEWLRFPDDLPDLRRLRPPGGNTRREGAAECHFVRRERGELPRSY